MASIKEGKDKTGKVVSWRVTWREGGRGADQQYETFRDRRRALRFRTEVEENGNRWPEGWVKGYGYGLPPETTTTTDFATFGHAYVDQIVELTPGIRRRYHSQVRILADLKFEEKRYFTTIEDTLEEDVKRWLINWPRALKTKANYHGLLWAIFNHAVRRKLISVNPCADTAPSRKAIRAESPEHVYLTEAEFRIFRGAADPDISDLLTVDVGTGLRLGEILALWVDDIDLEHRMIHVRKAWKHNGEDGASDTPPWLAKLLRPKHEIRDYYLGKPKTPKSRRTVEIGEVVAEVLERLIADKQPDDFVFTTPPRNGTSTAKRWAGGRAWHENDFYEGRWVPALDAAQKAGLRKRPRFHDLRHTYVSWAIAAGADLPYIQAQVGHESITTTIDEYGHLMPNSNRHVTHAFDVALRGGKIERYEALKIVR